MNDKVTKRDTGRSSRELGPCEVCQSHCSEVWIERTMGVSSDSDGTFEYHKGYRFGHEACLKGRP